MNLNRRGFLGGLITALVAPAIVRIDSIMPVRQVVLTPKDFLTLDEFSERILAPMMNNLANQVAKSIMDVSNANDHPYYVNLLRLPTDYKVAA